jgi:putative FmdB family regulatory protein
MPTYEYRCNNCERNFEVFQSITAEPISVCPVCGGHVQRLISGGGGLLFKGSGFYITDYRSESYKKAEKSEKTSVGGEKVEQKAGSSSSSKTEGASSSSA